ncbi:MAG: UDP-N-acetylmuramoyl-L-alanyl-D-glutamate--2,6-diaminopimelate ligase [Holophagales bacterium]|nr:UDP-N-acetylmuramoyl-L-alanyl-D-glutamate--2,6-diaminopimelate ligase [Holophagales bacterium]
MRLSALVQGLAVSGDLGSDPEVSGVRHDSRAVAPGDLFAAWRGARHDGADHVSEAAARGAAAVIADRERPEGVVADLPWLVAAEPRRLLAPLAAAIYRHPDRELDLVGVTGTNGKSTVVELLAAMLEAAGRPAGRLGTLGYRFPGLDTAPTERTTPEASDLLRLLREMISLGARAAAMEVSSHALAQGRVAGMVFRAAVFTNLTRDHFDFHADLEEYFATKASLFDQLAPGGGAAVSADDPFGRRLAERLPGAITFGAEGAVRPRRVELDARGIRGELATPAGNLAIETPLLGRYNLINVMAATAAAIALELPLEAIAEGIRSTRPLSGRMEPVDRGQSFPAAVDYAHTEAALEAAIRSFKELSGRKLVLVFGCGGDRDPGKRRGMGRIAGSLAELPIVTSDNPRGEDPLAIIAAVEEGLKASGNGSYRVVPDRREAIRRAVTVAKQSDWSVLVAGKGHERAQIVGDRRLPFSDREELERALGELARVGGEG